MQIDLTLFDSIETQLATLRAQCVAANVPPVTPPVVVPPSGYTGTMTNIEAKAGWIQPGNVGDTGGGSGKPNGSFLMTAGTPATFSVKGAYPYNNSYWYLPVGARNQATQFQLALAFMFPTASDLAASQAVEMELQQSTGLLVFNMAIQFTLAGAHTLKIFNYAAKQWEDTGIPFVLTPGQWTTVAAQFVRTATEMTHVGVTLNGVAHPIGKSHAGTATNGAGYLNAAFQLDSNGSNPPPAYSVKVQNYNVSFG